MFTSTVWTDDSKLLQELNLTARSTMQGGHHVIRLCKWRTSQLYVNAKLQDAKFAYPMGCELCSPAPTHQMFHTTLLSPQLNIYLFIRHNIAAFIVLYISDSVEIYKFSNQANSSTFPLITIEICIISKSWCGLSSSMYFAMIKCMFVCHHHFDSNHRVCNCYYYYYY